MLCLSLATFRSCGSDHVGRKWFPLCQRWTVCSSRLPAARRGGLRTDTDSFWSSAPAPKVNSGHKAFRPVIIWLLFTQGQKTNERVISASYKKTKKKEKRLVLLQRETAAGNRFYLNNYQHQWFRRTVYTHCTGVKWKCKYVEGGKKKNNGNYFFLCLLRFKKGSSEILTPTSCSIVVIHVTHFMH